MFRRLLPRRSLQSALILGGIVLFLPVCLFIVFSRHNEPPAYLLEHPYFLYDLDTAEPRNENQSCIFPRVHPFHPSVWDYLKPPKSIVCKSRKPSFTYITNTGDLKFNESEVLSSGYSIGETLYCYWSPVERGGINKTSDDAIVYGTEAPLEKDGIHIPFDLDIIHVQCRNFMGISVYDMLHARVRNASSSIVSPKHLSKPINVLIFGIDSMSRLGFIRLLPQTYRFLTEELKMTVFRGMNKVGDNTFPNLIAMLTGQEAYGGHLPDESQGFDDWPLIWKNYSSAGYVTMWAEDFPKFGLFNYLAKGFKQQPTLHYLRPFWLAVEASHLLKLSSHLCYGSKPKHQLQMKYVQDFVSQYKDARHPYFGFSFLAEFSHEYLTRVSSTDQQIEEFFHTLRDSGHLQNTVLIVMSDHGHRFDAIRSTQVGHIEERMPFYALYVPESIKSEEIDDHLKVNSGRLVTHFDTHATLLDILNHVTTGENLGKKVSHTLGLSLLGTIPANRTCSDAYIPVHYCTCESETSISSYDPQALLAAEATIHQINDMISNGGTDISKLCSPLKVGHIKSAHLVTNGFENPGQKVRVVVEAEPSKAIFEATVIVGDEIEVLGDISRINVYGDQSRCISHRILRKYCFCTVQKNPLEPNAK